MHLPGQDLPWETVLRRQQKGMHHVRLCTPPLHGCLPWTMVLRTIGKNLPMHWTHCLITTSLADHTVQIPSSSWEVCNQGSTNISNNGWHLDLCIFSFLFHKGLWGCGRNLFGNVSNAFVLGALLINMLCQPDPVASIFTNHISHPMVMKALSSQHAGE